MVVNAVAGKLERPVRLEKRPGVIASQIEIPFIQQSLQATFLLILDSTYVVKEDISHFTSIKNEKYIQMVFVAIALWIAMTAENISFYY